MRQTRDFVQQGRAHRIIGSAVNAGRVSTLGSGFTLGTGGTLGNLRTTGTSGTMRATGKLGTRGSFGRCGYGLFVLVVAAGHGLAFDGPQPSWVNNARAA